MIYLFRWHPYSFSSLSHFRSTNLHDHFINLCDKFWGISNFLPSTTRITSKISRPNLNSFVHLATVEYEGAESPSTFWNSVWISFVFVPLSTNLLESQFFFFHYQKSVRGKNNRESSRLLSCSESTDAPRVHSQRRVILLQKFVALSLTSRGDSEHFSNLSCIEVIYWKHFEHSLWVSELIHFEHLLKNWSFLTHV